MDEGTRLLKGQLFLLQLMFYLLSSETEPDMNLDDRLQILLGIIQ